MPYEEEMKKIRFTLSLLSLSNDLFKTAVTYNEESEGGLFCICFDRDCTCKYLFVPTCCFCTYHADCVLHAMLGNALEINGHSCNQDQQ